MIIIHIIIIIKANYRYSYYPSALLINSSDTTFFVSRQNENNYLAEVSREIIISNNFSIALTINNINCVTPEIKLQHLVKNINLHLFRKNTIFTLVFDPLYVPKSITSNNLTITRKTLYKTYLVIISGNLLLPIPIKIYDKTLYCQLKSDDDFFNERCNEAINVNLDFGPIAINESRKKSISFINYNPIDITIISMPKLSTPYCIDVILENLYDKDGQIILENKKAGRKGSKKNPLLTLGPGYTAEFSFTIRTFEEEVFEDIFSVVTSEVMIGNFDI